MKKRLKTRREMISIGSAATTSILLPDAVSASLKKIKNVIKLGVISDLHQDIMHDGPSRLNEFLMAMKKEKPDALIQLGDFAYPTKKNEIITKVFGEAHPKSLHVLGNHEIDGGHSFQDVAKIWGMKGRYYTENINGLDLIVLDGNERPKDHKSGYPSFIGKEQYDWLAEQLKSLEGPILIASHQPLAGPSSIDNADKIQKLLNESSDKILLAINGHTHIDHVEKIKEISYLHINSASYKWVGGSYRNKSYSAEIHKKFPWIEYTCPYRDSLFSTLSIDPTNGRIDVVGRSSNWVGKSPSLLAIPSKPNLTDGKEICPLIRNRQFEFKSVELDNS